MDFIYLFRVLSKRKWLILAAGLLAASLAYVLTLNQPKKYRSSAQISTGFTVPDETRPNANYNYLEAESNFNNVIVTFTSPSVISLLSYDLILHDITSAHPFYRRPSAQVQGAILKDMTLEQAQTLFHNKLESMSMLTSYKRDEKKLLELLEAYGYDYKTLTRNLNVYQLNHTDYIQIDYSSSNPDLSAYVVNDIFQQFLQYYGSIRKGRTTESVDTLRSLVEKKKQIADGKYMQLRQMGVSATDEKGNNNVELIMSLEGSITDLENKRTGLIFDLEKVNQRIQNLNPTQATNINDEILTARNAANEANKAYLDNPTDKNLFNKYNQLNKEYLAKLKELSTVEKAESKGETKNDLLTRKNDISLDIQAINQNIRTLQGRVSNLKGTLLNDASKGAAVQSLLKEAELANKEYLDAKQAYNRSSDLNSATLNNFKMVTPGQPAIDPEPSKRAIIIIGAGAAAVITTIIIITLLTYLDSSIKTPIIFSKTVGLKLLSLVNFTDFKNKSLADIIANKEKESDVFEKNRNNVFRESLRKLRYEIETSGKKIFLITSTKKGQGKTTIIQALSYSMSMSKKKILIIDTNFCNNDLTIQLEAQPILEKIIPNKSQNALNLSDQVKGFSKIIGTGSIYAIGSEGGDYTPSEILPRENLLHHLHSLTGEFDYIFLEGPPLNDFSDSKELAQYVDGVIAVFSANHVMKQIDKQSMAFFKELNGKFSGCILNMVDMSNVNSA